IRFITKSKVRGRKSTSILAGSNGCAIATWLSGSSSTPFAEVESVKLSVSVVMFQALFSGRHECHLASIPPQGGRENPVVLQCRLQENKSLAQARIYGVVRAHRYSSRWSMLSGGPSHS